MNQLSHHIKHQSKKEWKILQRISEEKIFNIQVHGKVPLVPERSVAGRQTRPEHVRQPLGSYLLWQEVHGSGPSVAAPRDEVTA